MDLTLVKISSGLCSGEVLYHRYIQKSPAEIEAMRKEAQGRELARKQRRAQQEANVARKQAEREQRRKALLAERRAKGDDGELVTDSDGEGAPEVAGYDSDNDAGDGDALAAAQDAYENLDDFGDDLDLDDDGADVVDADVDAQDGEVGSDQSDDASTPVSRREQRGAPSGPLQAPAAVPSVVPLKAAKRARPSGKAPVRGGKRPRRNQTAR